MMFCSNCSEENPDEAKFCRMCGKKIPFGQRKKKYRGFFKWLGIIAGLWVIFVVMVEIFG